MAIARDSNNNHQTWNDPGSPKTVAFTNTAGNLLYLGLVLRDKGDVLTSVTYAGSGMSVIGKVNYSGTSWAYLLGLVSPATGANNFVITYTGGSSDNFWQAVSYSGASTAGVSNASKTNTGSGTTVSDTITFVNTPAWVTMWSAATGGSLTASTNSTAIGTAFNFQFFDSNGTQTGSTFNMQQTASSGAWGDIMVSFVEPAAATDGNFLMFM